jgi:hypothetical protein
VWFAIGLLLGAKNGRSIGKRSNIAVKNVNAIKQNN